MELWWGARGQEVTLSLRSISEVPFKTSFAKTWSHGHTSLHCPLSAGHQCAQSKKGSVTEEKEEKIVGVATSGLRHHHLTSSFVPHSAVILIGRYFFLWSLSKVISVYSSRILRNSLNLLQFHKFVQTLLESHDVRLHCSLLLFP